MFNHARMLIAAGRIAEACDWIACAGEAGHARFRAQMADWLARRDERQLREAGEALSQACD